MHFFEKISVFSLPSRSFLESIWQVSQLFFQQTNLSAILLFFWPQILQMSLVSVLLLSNNLQLVIFMLMPLLLNLLRLELFFLFFSELVILLFFMLKLIPQVINLFLELRNLCKEALFFGEEYRKFWVKFLSDVFKGYVWDESGILQREICVGGFILSEEPMSDGLTFVGVSVRGDDGVVHLGLGDGTCPLLFKRFNEVVIFAIHLNIFYKVYGYNEWLKSARSLIIHVKSFLYNFLILHL